MKDKFRGAFIGLAVGDALGVPAEFKSPRTFRPVKDLIGGGPYDLKPGEWTDDTSMALCLAESLIETNGFNPIDQLQRYLRWYREGHLSVNDRCFDIGDTTKKAIENFEITTTPYSEYSNDHGAGNGSIMRLAPVPLFFNSNPLVAIEKSGESSKTTHKHPFCIDACRYMGGLILGGLLGESKEKLLSARYSPVKDYWKENFLSAEIDEIACGSYKLKNPPQIQGRGFVVKSLEAALWAFYNSDNFEEGCLKAVNLGNDADTTGAVYGQIAGAYYGEKDIPKRWISKLARFEVIDNIVDNLFEISTAP